MGAKKKIIKRLTWLKHDADLSRDHDEWEQGYYNAMRQAIQIIKDELKKEKK